MMPGRSAEYDRRLTSPAAHVRRIGDGLQSADHSDSNCSAAILNKNDAETRRICLVNNQLWQCASNTLTARRNASNR
jgi:hypothetical protein